MPDRTPTMTLAQVYHELREAGIKSSPQRIAAGIESGALPFGEVSFVGDTGRRSFLIWRVDFEAWLESKLPKPHQPQLIKEATKNV